MRDQLEILGSVVCPVAVDVVDIFINAEWATDDALHNEAVLPNADLGSILKPDAALDVALGVCPPSDRLLVAPPVARPSTPARAILGGGPNGPEKVSAGGADLVGELAVSAASVVSQFVELSLCLWHNDSLLGQLQ